jgi:hypothetical protein
MMELFADPATQQVLTIVVDQDPDSMPLWIRIQGQENDVITIPVPVLFCTFSPILYQKGLMWIRIRFGYPDSMTL